MISTLERPLDEICAVLSDCHIKRIRHPFPLRLSQSFEAVVVNGNCLQQADLENKRAKVGVQF